MKTGMVFCSGPAVVYAVFFLFQNSPRPGNGLRVKTQERKNFLKVFCVATCRGLAVKSTFFVQNLGGEKL